MQRNVCRHVHGRVDRHSREKKVDDSCVRVYINRERPGREYVKDESRDDVVIQARNVYRNACTHVQRMYGPVC